MPPAQILSTLRASATPSDVFVKGLIENVEAVPSLRSALDPTDRPFGDGPRSTGPSDADLDACNSVMVPGFLYDYDADEVPPGHSKTDSASVIYYGPERKVLQDEEKL